MAAFFERSTRLVRRNKSTIGWTFVDKNKISKMNNRSNIATTAVAQQQKQYGPTEPISSIL